MSTGDDSVLTSTRNPSVRDAVELHRSRERRRRNETLLEGPHLVKAAADAGMDITRVFVLEGEPSVLDDGLFDGATIVSQHVMDKLAPSVHPRGPVAILQIPKPAPLGGGDTLVLFAVSDPGNVGTLIRTAAAFDWRVAVAPNTVDLWSPKVLRSGAGAHFSVPLSVLEDDAMMELRTAGFHISAAVPVDGVWPPPAVNRVRAVLVGSEAHGLPEDVAARADDRISIPTSHRSESLNAAVAGSILLYEMAPGSERA